MENKKLELVFSVEKDTKNTRRYKEEVTDGPPVIPVCLWQTGARSTSSSEHYANSTTAACLAACASR